MSRTAAEARVYALLLADAAVSALVADRVYPLAAKQAAPFPLIVYRRVSTNRLAALEGEAHLEFVRIQVECEAESYDAAKGLAHAVLDAMDGAATFKSLPDGQVDGYEPETGIYTVSLDFQVANEEE